MMGVFECVVHMLMCDSVTATHSFSRAGLSLSKDYKCFGARLSIHMSNAIQRKSATMET